MQAGSAELSAVGAGALFLSHNQPTQPGLPGMDRCSRLPSGACLALPWCPATRRFPHLNLETCCHSSPGRWTPEGTLPPRLPQGSPGAGAMAPGAMWLWLDKARGYVFCRMLVMDCSSHSRAFPPSVSSEIEGTPVSEISGPFSTDDIASNCVPTLPLNEPILWIVSYTLMSVCGIILLTLIILLLLPVRCRHGPGDPEVVNDESSLVRHRWK